MPTDITTILTDDEIGALREGFSNDYMVAGARAALIQRLPRSAPLINADLQLFYRADYGAEPGDIGPSAREKVVLTALAVSGNWDMAAIHVYWALSLNDAPMTPAEIGEVILLAGSYSGVQVISMGLATVEKVFGLLKKAVAAGVTTSDKLIPILLGGPVPIADPAEKQ